MSRHSPDAPNPEVLVDRHLDVMGSLCPIPAIRTKQILDEMPPGQVLEVRASDPLAEMDLAIVCQRGGHELLESDSSGECVRVLIRVASPDEG